MVAGEMHKAPTPFEELLFIDSIYRTREELQETLQERGFKMYTEIDVPKVDCFMYLPVAFPENREEVLPLVLRLMSMFCIGG